MLNCGYCNDLFIPRPQVKNPKACYKDKCQSERQRANEKAWHNRNLSSSDSIYHNAKRVVRLKFLNDIKSKIMEGISVGLKMLGSAAVSADFELLLGKFLLALGLRRVNKLWIP